jgi:hypothetical protein
MRGRLLAEITSAGAAIRTVPVTSWAAYSDAAAAAWPARGGMKPATGPGSRTNCQGPRGGAR